MNNDFCIFRQDRNFIKRDTAAGTDDGRIFSGRIGSGKWKLSEIFLQLHISEKSGRGVPKIIETYGREAFTFRENSIVVTIPLHRIKKVGNKVGNKKGLNARRQRIITEMRDNPNITTSELHQILGISETAVENNLTFLKKNGYVERVGSKKTGYWKVLE